MKLFKLGTKVEDIATKREGMLTVCVVGMDNIVQYLFQPDAISEKTGHPVKGIFLNPSRIKGGIEIEVNDLPMAILGTEVKDIATPFKGTANAIYIYESGCVHIEIQSKKVIDQTNESAEPMHLDILRLEGKAVPKKTAEEKAVSKKEKPSPCGEVGNRFPTV